MKTMLSAYWHPALEALLKKKLKHQKKPFPMSLTGTAEINAVMAAVNQGIDSHLESCYLPARGDSYTHGERSLIATDDGPKWKKGDRVVHTLTLECQVSMESLPVLIRRLLEADDDEANSLAMSICDVLGIDLV